jgi:hypothetical protein
VLNWRSVPVRRTGGQDDRQRIGGRAGLLQLRQKKDEQSSNTMTENNRIFVPFSEHLLETTGLGIGRLVPFQLEYECVRLHGWESVEIEPAAPEKPESELQPH